jgi:hypothetical protein
VIYSNCPEDVILLEGKLFTILSSLHLLISTIISLIIPKHTINVRGKIVARGSFVLISGISYKIALKT